MSNHAPDQLDAQSEGELRHRNDLARDAARAWRAFQAACTPGAETADSFLRFSTAWEECGAALDRLAAAHLDTPTREPQKGPDMTG